MWFGKCMAQGHVFVSSDLGQVHQARAHVLDTHFAWPGRSGCTDAGPWTDGVTVGDVVGDVVGWLVVVFVA